MPAAHVSHAPGAAAGRGGHTLTERADDRRRSRPQDLRVTYRGLYDDGYRRRLLSRGAAQAVDARVV